jgi:transcriptional regulator with XRE-family HTH domain
MRDARKQAGLSQANLAEHLGTTRQLISRLEQGDVSDQLLLILRILDRLQIRLCLERR